TRNGARLAPLVAGHERGGRSMTERDRFAPAERESDFEFYDAAPPSMPPSPAGANTEAGGEAAASRRNAGLPEDFEHRPDRTPGRPPPGPEPFLGFDGLDADASLQWARDTDPGPALLSRIVHYERRNRNRDLVIDECNRRLERLRGPETRGD